MAMIICPNCGLEISDKMKECFSCGARIKQQTNNTMYFPISRSAQQDKTLLFAEIPIEHTNICKSAIHSFSVVQHGDESLSFDQAIELYYHSPDVFFEWKFPIHKIALRPEKKTYCVIGNDVPLGYVERSKYNENNVKLIDELIQINAIDHIECKIKDGKYFHLTKEEYQKYVHSDPYGRGYAQWSDDRSPDIVLYVYFLDGIVNLSDFGTDVQFPLPEDFDL